MAFWLPRHLLAALDMGVEKEDSDRSKFVRKAIREKLHREGVLSAEVAA